MGQCRATGERWEGKRAEEQHTKKTQPTTNEDTQTHTPCESNGTEVDLSLTNATKLTTTATRTMVTAIQQQKLRVTIKTCQRKKINLTLSKYNQKQQKRLTSKKRQKKNYNKKD